MPAAVPRLASFLALAAQPRCGGCGDALAAFAIAAGSGGAQAPAASWCEHCRDRWGTPPGFWPAGAGCPGWAAAAYRGRVRRAVLQAKRGAPAAAVSLLLDRWPRGQLPVDAVVTWVPAHPRRAVTRPDSGRALAQAIAARDGLPAERLLWRVPWARRQAGRSNDARRADPQRLGLRTAAAVPSSVVLVDDVRTTGATLDHASALLRAAGAEQVVGLTVASAPVAPVRGWQDRRA